MPANDLWVKTSPSPLAEEPVSRHPLAHDMAQLRELIQHASSAPIKSLAAAIIDLRLVDTRSLQTLQFSPTGAKHESGLALLNAGLVSELELEHVRAHMLNIPKVDAASFQVEPQALNRLSWSVALKHHVLPLGFDSGVLYVACATPLSRELDLELSVIADCMVSLVWGEQSQIAQRLKLENHAPLTPQSARSANPDSQLDAEPPVPPDVHTLLNEALIEMKSGNELELVSAVNESSSVIKLVNQMIIDAYEQKASDIHIETNQGDAVSRVRFRKDGDSRN